MFKLLSDEQLLFILDPATEKKLTGQNSKERIKYFMSLEIFKGVDIPYQEISKNMNLPVKKVKSAIQNGKRNLKLKLEKNDNFKSA